MPWNMSSALRCTQCCLNAWAPWTVTPGPHQHRGPMLIYECCAQHVFLMFKHWLCWKYQCNKYMFNLIDNYIFIIVNGCVCSGPVHCFSMLLRWPWLYIEIVHRLVLRSRHEICPVNHVEYQKWHWKSNSWHFIYSSGCVFVFF